MSRYLLEDEEFVDMEREAMDYEFNSLYDHKIGMFSPAEYPGHREMGDGDDPVNDHLQLHTCYSMELHAEMWRRHLGVSEVAVPAAGRDEIPF